MSETPYRLFDAVLARKRRLSPALARLTLAGADIRAMRTVAPDQRIKIFFPSREGAPSALPKRPDWLQTYKAIPPAGRAPMRTYTIRRLRAEHGEVDVDFVLHGATGPASRWATGAQPGDRVQIAAPNAAFTGDPGGYEWKPPAGVRHVLLIADETALPAAAGILEDMASWAEPPVTQAFFETPGRADRLDLPSWPSLKLEWLARDAGAPAPFEGALIARAAERAIVPARGEGAGEALAPIDIDAQILWEPAAPSSGDFYAWVAGEAGAVARIRKLLAAERGVDRKAMTLMGYWRRGRALDDAA